MNTVTEKCRQKLLNDATISCYKQIPNLYNALLDINTENDQVAIQDETRTPNESGIYCIIPSPGTLFMWSFGPLSCSVGATKQCPLRYSIDL